MQTAEWPQEPPSAQSQGPPENMLGPSEGKTPIKASEVSARQKPVVAGRFAPGHVFKNHWTRAKTVMKRHRTETGRVLLS